MKRVPLRSRLFLLVVAGILPLALVSGMALFYLHQQNRQSSEKSVLEVARALSIAIDAELRRTMAVLEVLSTTSLIDEGNLRGFHERARRTIERQRNWQAVLLFDATGKPLINSGAPFGTPLAPAVESESLASAIEKAEPLVGFLVKGPSGRWGFPVRYPVLRGGAVRYVLTAVIDPAAILEVLVATRVPGEWVVSVADAKGLRVTRTRSAAQTAGTPYSPSLVAMMDSAGGEGSGVTTTTEGTQVFTAFTRSRATSWITAVGLPVSGVEQTARTSFMTFGAGILVSILLGVAAALAIARSINHPMAQLRDVALREGRIDPMTVPETDIREIQDVARALVTSEQERARGEAERENLLRSEQSARATAEAANRAKDEFLAMLGHELRNPLSAISNATALLDHPGIEESRKQDANAIIGRQVAHLTRLTDDLLDAGRAIMGKIVLQRRPLDFAAIVRQSLATLAASGRTQKHRIESTLETVWVDADPIRLDQVIANLVVNAVKYSPASSVIRVSLMRERGDAVLRVCDEGIGIPADLRARVFDLFVQGDRDLDRALGGLGIGLTLVRRLAQMHGGTADVTSEGEGKGSQFTARLPAIDAPAARDAPAVSYDATGGRDVLVIEDNEDARETLRMLLETGGHRVNAEPDGESGLATALRTRPEVMLVDIGLPRMDGYEVARRVRADAGWTRRPLMVAITGYGQAGDRENALAAGFDLHLAKPVEPQRLLEIIATASSAT
ncbi:MAG: ATP-binding protein [Usitatibacter sp.]